ncbi:MAG: FAD synthetase family protein [Clostridiales bacterium]|nr:FAD synthetase family protein [Clostridiales bacterium]
MRVFQLETLPCGTVTPSVVCLGVFDGVHLGHQKLIAECLRVAKENDLLPILHTYEPLPMQVIAPDEELLVLTTTKERLNLIEHYGIKSIAISRFDHKLQYTSGLDFFEQVLLGKLNAKHIVAGYDHRFGFNGDTDILKLKALCTQKGIGVSVIPPVKTPAGQLISSTAIRKAIVNADYDLAEEMLGRPLEHAMKQRLNNTVLSREGKTEV